MLRHLMLSVPVTIAGFYGTMPPYQMNNGIKSELNELMIYYYIGPRRIRRNSAPSPHYSPGSLCRLAPSSVLVSLLGRSPGFEHCWSQHRDRQCLVQLSSAGVLEVSEAQTFFSLSQHSSMGRIP